MTKRKIISRISRISRISKKLTPARFGKPAPHFKNFKNFKKYFKTYFLKYFLKYFRGARCPIPWSCTPSRPRSFNHHRIPRPTPYPAPHPGTSGLRTCRGGVVGHGTMICQSMTSCHDKKARLACHTATTGSAGMAKMLEFQNKNY